MDVSSHPAYREEQDQLRATLRRIDDEQRFLLQRNQELEKEVARTAGDPVLYNIFHTSRVNIAFNREQLESLDQIREQAYFARLDFRERGSTDETIYLGRLGLVSRQNGEVVIVDWREPIATLYYGGTEGEMAYDAPGGLIECEVSLKRQLEVERDVLLRLFDARPAQAMADPDASLPRDELLLSRLGQQADRRLRDIVSTIQREQNAIIRAGLDRPLVVQGVAGSGKTTVALHRLAYLLYRYRDTLAPANVLIIAPNRVFLTYISEVLPALGVHDVTQCTLQEYLQSVLGRSLPVLPSQQKLLLFLDQTDNLYLQATRELARQASAVKGDLRFLTALDQLAEAAVRAALPKAPLRLFDQELISPQQIWERYQQEGTVAPPVQRLEAVKRHVTRLADERLQQAIQAGEQRIEQQMQQLRQARGQGSKQMLQLYQQKTTQADSLRREQQETLARLLQQFGRLDAVDVYQALIEDVAALRQLCGKVFPRQSLEAVALLATQLGQGHWLELEDLAPLAYLHWRLCGVNPKVRFQHLVIDEGQDLNPLEVRVLRLIAGHSSFTLVGDVSQSIQPGRGVHDWQEVIDGSFAGSECQSYTLTLSYRTTAEIVLFANQVLRSRHFAGQLAQPVMRSGALPFLGAVEAGEAQADLAAGVIRQARAQGLHTVALVTRTAEQARAAHLLLQARGVTAVLMQGDGDEYEGGVLVMPAYLTKGLEFDAVIVYDAGRRQFDDRELDAKLLYVALTRAMHQLYVLYTDEVSPLLRGVEAALYQPLPKF